MPYTILVLAFIVFSTPSRAQSANPSSRSIGIGLGGSRNSANVLAEIQYRQGLGPGFLRLTARSSDIAMAPAPSRFKVESEWQIVPPTPYAEPHLELLVMYGYALEVSRVFALTISTGVGYASVKVARYSGGTRTAVARQESTWFGSRTVYDHYDSFDKERSMESNPMIPFDAGVSCQVFERLAISAHVFSAIGPRKLTGFSVGLELNNL